MWPAFTTTPHLWVDLAIDGWVIPPSFVLEPSNTVPRVSSGFGQYESLGGRATGIRQQLLWVTTVEGPRVRQQQAQAHIGVHLDTRIHSARASSCTARGTPDSRRWSGADSVAKTALGSELVCNCVSVDQSTFIPDTPCEVLHTVLF